MGAVCVPVWWYVSSNARGEGKRRGGDDGYGSGYGAERTEEEKK